MHGDLGNKLVLNAKRSQSASGTSSAPPPHATDLVRSILLETRSLDATVQAILSRAGTSFTPASDPATACALLVNHLAMRRNKRCLLAYHRARADMLERFAWAGRDVGDLGNAQAEMRVDEGDEAPASGGAGGQLNLSPEEIEYLRAYGDLLASYKGQWTDVDLTGSTEPPRDLFIDVRVLKDAGEIQTEYGYVTLKNIHGEQLINFLLKICNRTWNSDADMTYFFSLC